MPATKKEVLKEAVAKAAKSATQGAKMTAPRTTPPAGRPIGQVSGTQTARPTFRPQTPDRATMAPARTTGALVPPPTGARPAGAAMTAPAARINVETTGAVPKATMGSRVAPAPAQTGVRVRPGMPTRIQGDQTILKTPAKQQGIKPVPDKFPQESDTFPATPSVPRRIYPTPRGPMIEGQDVYPKYYV